MVKSVSRYNDIIELSSRYFYSLIPIPCGVTISRCRYHLTNLLYYIFHLRVYPTCVCSYSDREWHNTHEDLHRPTMGDTANNRPDTVVHLEEFRALIQEALNASRVPGGKDEL